MLSQTVTRIIELFPNIFYTLYFSFFRWPNFHFPKVTTSGFQNLFFTMCCSAWITFDNKKSIHLQVSTSIKCTKKKKVKTFRSAETFLKIHCCARGILLTHLGEDHVWGYDYVYRHKCIDCFSSPVATCMDGHLQKSIYFSGCLAKTHVLLGTYYTNTRNENFGT